jgi:mono/diheme cytochrome c family protein
MKLLFVAIAAVPVLLFGCGGGGTRSSGDPGKDSPQPTQMADASFKGDIQPIFSKHCAHPSCHGVAQSAGLQLSEGMAYGNIVNVRSTEQPQYMRIKPGEPDSSYIVLKIEGKQAVGSRMPLTGGYLSDKQIQTVRSWVKEGAKND